VGSHIVTALVAVVLGIIVGVVGLAALRTQLSPSASTVSSQFDVAPSPSYYGSR